MAVMTPNSGASHFDRAMKRAGFAKYENMRLLYLSRLVW
jgi:GH35 family endo-1,4-beta-xylanase